MSNKELQIAEEAEHALLSASGAKIWLACPRSARFSEPYADQGSEFAEEGTAAHTYAELRIRAELGEDTAAAAQAFRDENKWYDGEMEEAITGYANLVIERFNEARASTPDAVIFTEQRLDYSQWVPEGFGTGDIIIIADGVLEVIDLKYGKGVPVSAAGNPQLKLYGAGAYGAYGMLYDIDAVQTTICQPRLDSITTDTVKLTTLLEWLDQEVRPKAAQAWEGTGEFNAGEHCRFCKGLPHCRALADYNLELAKHDFKEGDALTIDEIADILGRIDLLTTWAGKVQEYALKRAVNDGVDFPGWKLVEGRSNRKYADQDKVAAALVKAGYAEALIYERSLLGITAMEKAIGKKTFTALLTDYIIKPPGAPKLAPEADKRAELGSNAAAKADFEE